MSSSQSSSPLDRWTIEKSDEGIPLVFGDGKYPQDPPRPASALEIALYEQLERVAEAADAMSGAFTAHMVSVGYGSPEREEHSRGTVRAYHAARGSL